MCWKQPSWTYSEDSDVEQSVASYISNKSTTQKRPSKNYINQKNRHGSEEFTLADKVPTNHKDTDGIRIYIEDEVTFLKTSKFKTNSGIVIRSSRAKISCKDRKGNITVRSGKNVKILNRI